MQPKWGSRQLELQRVLSKMVKVEILKTGLFLILFFGSVWGTGLPDIPEEEIRRAISHTVFIITDVGVCHGVIVSPSKVLTVAHCVDDIEANDLEDLEVAIYTSKDDLIFLTSQDSFKEIPATTIRRLAVNRLIGERMSIQIKDPFRALISSDDGQAEVIGEASNSPGVVTVQQIHKVYIHPDYREEDVAVIMLKEIVPFHIDINASIESSFKKQADFSADEFLEDDFDLSDLFSFSSMLNGQEETNTLPEEEIFPLDCFTTDWRDPDSAYQQTQLLTFELFSRLIGPTVSSVQEELPTGILKGFDFLVKSDTFRKSVMIEMYRKFLLGDKFAPQYAENHYPQKGYSGGPVWCYDPETGLHLKGYAIGKAKDQLLDVFITRKFDEGLYQWIEEQE